MESDDSFPNSNASQGGWLSDDEPPQDRVGDLHPLAVDSKGKLSAFRQIIELGTNIPTQGGPEDLLVVECRRIQSDQGLRENPEWATTLLTGDPAVVTAQEFCAASGLAYEAVKLMRISETAVIWEIDGAEGDVIDKKKRDWTTLQRLAGLQKKRRVFAKKNATGDQWDLVPQKQKSFRPTRVIKLQRVETRTDYGPYSKSISEASTSWKTPNENSSLQLEVKLGATTKTHTVELKLSDLESPEWREMLRSIKLGEEIRVRRASKEGSVLDARIPELLRSEVVDVSESRLTGAFGMKVKLVRLTEGTEYKVQDDGCGLEQRTSGGSCDFELQTISSQRTVEHDAKFRTFGGSDFVQSGDLVLMQGKTGVFSLYVDRAECVAPWIHRVLKSCKFGVTHRIVLKRDASMLPRWRRRDSKEYRRWAAVLSEGLEHLRVFSPQLRLHKLCGDQEKVLYVDADDSLVRLNRVDVDSGDLEEFIRCGSFKSVKAGVYRDSDALFEEGKGVLDFEPLALIAREINPWQSSPSAAVSHAIALAVQAARSINLPDVVVGAADFLDHLCSRHIEEDEQTNIDLLAEILRKRNEKDAARAASIVPQPADGTFQSHIPELFYELRNIALFLRCLSGDSAYETVRMIAQAQRSSKNALRSDGEDPLTLALNTLKAISEFELGSFEECRATCQPYQHKVEELESLSAVAFKSMKVQRQESKKMFQRMFQ